MAEFKCCCNRIILCEINSSNISHQINRILNFLNIVIVHIIIILHSRYNWQRPSCLFVFRLIFNHLSWIWIYSINFFFDSLISNFLWKSAYWFVRRTCWKFILWLSIEWVVKSIRISFIKGRTKSISWTLRSFLSCWVKSI